MVNIAVGIQWRQHGLGKARGFVEHRIDRLTVGLLETEALVQGLGAENIKQGEADIAQRSRVGMHGRRRVSASRRAVRAQG